jgi:uncharacterized membrane protein
MTTTTRESTEYTSRTSSVEQLTQRNIEVVRKLEEAANQERTTSDRVARMVARFCGSMTFVWVHVIGFAGWILLNTLPGVKHIDPFPFTFLTFVVSLEAIFLSTFILISQNYDTRVSERRNHLDLQINLLSEQENTKMLLILQAIAERVGAEIEPDDDVTVLAQETELEKVVAQIEQHTETQEQNS